MEDKYVSVKEAAQHLRLSERTIYKMLWGGKFPDAVRVGRAIRIPASAFESLRPYEPPSARQE